MTRDELYAEAKQLNIPNRSKMSKAELEAAIRAEGIDLEVLAHEKYNEPYPIESAPYNEHSEARACEESDTFGGETDCETLGCSCPKICSDCGGAVGTNYKAGCEGCATHVVECVPRFSLTNESEMKTLDWLHSKDSPVNFSPKCEKPAHMPNSERVQKYARQALRRRLEFTRNLPNVKLTAKQMRRVRKNANKHGEGFFYQTTNCSIAYEGHSLLARTPEGLGIFYQFIK